MRANWKANDSTPVAPAVVVPAQTVAAQIVPAAMIVAVSGVKPANCGKLTKDADGTVSPVICPNGRPNAKALASIKSATPKMANLGAQATWKQIKTATCADVRNASVPMVTDSYQWLATRYDWLSRGLPGAESFGTKVARGLCT
jgi:hypothetical protein